MTAFARHPNASTYAYGASDADDDYAPVELFPGERIGRPLAHSQYWTAVRRGICMLLVIASGWAFLDERVSLPKWVIDESKALYASLEGRVKTLTETSAPAAVSSSNDSVPANGGTAAKLAALDQPLPPEPVTAASAASVAPVVEIKEAERPATTVPPSPEPDAAPMSGPLPPPVVDPADPNQKKAVAVGLHPELSRVLLARLSAADYRNAGVAIQTALAETADNSVYIWPLQKKPDLAMFKVHFVPGAVDDCRRYVVTVSKDGWLTTALPLEKCGIRRRPAEAATAKSASTHDVFRTEAASR